MPQAGKLCKRLSRRSFFVCMAQPFFRVFRPGYFFPTVVPDEVRSSGHGNIRKFTREIFVRFIKKDLTSIDYLLRAAVNQ